MPYLSPAQKTATCGFRRRSRSNFDTRYQFGDNSLGSVPTTEGTLRGDAIHRGIDLCVVLSSLTDKMQRKLTVLKRGETNATRQKRRWSSPECAATSPWADPPPYPPPYPPEFQPPPPPEGGSNRPTKCKGVKKKQKETNFISQKTWGEKRNLAKFSEFVLSAISPQWNLPPPYSTFTLKKEVWWPLHLCTRHLAVLL